MSSCARASGLGGIFVEVKKDVSIRLLPINEREARAMLMRRNSTRKVRK
jgi:acyl-CoA synthetase (NDP forming)